MGHQIKALELELNTSLFRRETRKIVLTDEGRKLSAEVGNALDVLEDAVALVRNHELTGKIEIAIAPFFGNRWLLPRLSAFHNKHPGIQIEPHLSFDYVDLEKSGFDAAVRYGAGNWAGLTSTLIFNDRIRPICAPQLVAGLSLPLTVKDLLTLPLAGAGRWREDWFAWADAAGSPIEDTNQIVEYESRAFMFDAALSGNAVILADKRMTAADECAGRLVELNALQINRPQGIYVVAERKRARDPRLALFIDWLKHEAA